MPLYLTILEGASPSDAETILATSDERILRVVAAEISRRLGAKGRPLIRKLHHRVKPEVQPSNE